MRTTFTEGVAACTVKWANTVERRAVVMARVEVETVKVPEWWRESVTGSVNHPNECMAEF